MKALNNTFGVTFYLRRYKINQDGTIPIYLRITVNGKRLEISVKRTVVDKNWKWQKVVHTCCLPFYKQAYLLQIHITHKYIDRIYKKMSCRFL